MMNVFDGAGSILLAAFLIGVVGATSIVGSSALFSDTESPTGNVFAAWNGSNETTPTPTAECTGRVLAPGDGETYHALRMSGDSSFNVSYQTVIDAPTQVKFEDAEPGLGEDGQVETDFFNVNVSSPVNDTVLVETKAGQSTDRVTLVGEGSINLTSDGLWRVGIEEIGQGNGSTMFTFSVTSDDEEGQDSPALSHITFLFCPGTNELFTPGNPGNQDDAGSSGDDNVTGDNETMSTPPINNTINNSMNMNNSTNTTDENDNNDNDNNDNDNNDGVGQPQPQQEENLDLRLSDSDEFNQNGVTATWTMPDNMLPGDSTTAGLTLSNDGTVEGDSVRFRFNVSEIDPGCEAGDNEEPDTLCGAANMSSFLEIDDMIYADHVFDLDPDTGDFQDVNSNGYIDFQDLADSTNNAALTGLTAPSGGVETLTMAVKFREDAGNEYQGDVTVVDIAVSLVQEG